MAVVWRARDEVLGRLVAIKLLAGPYASDPSSRRRIRDEARAAATLSHHHIAQVYDYGESTADGECVPYVVMELVSGGTLAQRLTAAPMAVRESFRACAQVAEALAAAHADGLVHRDIKPANVMITPTGIKVVDFGIAAAIGSGGGADGTGSDAPGADDAAELLGTPAYLAPERLTGGAVEPASDVYALGVMLYRMLAGHSPWSADTTTKMLAAHIYVDPTPLPRLPDVPDYVTGLVNRCLSKDPMQRPSAREVAAMLSHAAGNRAGDHGPAPVTGPFPADGEPSRPLTWPPGPAALGPPLSGLPLSGPPLSGQLMAAAAGPSAAGLPPVSGSPVSGSPVPGSPVSGSPVSGAPVSAPAGFGSAGIGPVGFGLPATGAPASGPDAAREPAAVPALRPATPRDGALRRRITVGAGAVAVGATGAVLWLVLQPGYEASDNIAGLPDKPPAPSASVVAPATSPAPVDGSAPARTDTGPAAGPTARRPAGQADTSGQGRQGRPAATDGPARGGADSGGADPGGAGPVANADDDAATGGDRAGPGDDAGADNGGGSEDNGGGQQAPPTDTPTAAPRAHKLTSGGGSVEAICRSAETAEILSYSAARSYKMRNLEAGPSSAPRIDFKHGNRTVRMVISCRAGTPFTDNTSL